jgi:hypothetical protein
MDSSQAAGPSSFHYDTDDQMAASGAGRKRVGFTSDPASTHLAPSSHSPEGPDTGSGGHSTPLERPDLTQDQIESLERSLRLALGGEELSNETLQARASSIPPRDVQKPRPAIRKAPRTPPEFQVNDQSNPFDDDVERVPSLGAQLKERSGFAAQRRAAKLSRSVGTYSAPVSRRNSKDMPSPPVELQNMAKAYESVGDTTDEEDDPQFLKRASLLLRQHTVRGGSQEGLVSLEDLYHTEAPLRSGQVTPVAGDIEDEHVPRPTKYRTGVLGTLLKAANATQRTHLGRSGHSRNVSTETLSGASTAANSPSSSPPASGYSTPRGGRSWFNRNYDNPSTTSISQLVGASAHSLATPAQRELGQEFGEQYKKSRPGLGKRSKPDESLAPFKKARRREDDVKIKIHL